METLIQFISTSTNIDCTTKSWFFEAYGRLVDYQVVAVGSVYFNLFSDSENRDLTWFSEKKTRNLTWMVTRADLEKTIKHGNLRSYIHNWTSVFKFFILFSSLPTECLYKKIGWAKFYHGLNSKNLGRTVESFGNFFLSPWVTVHHSLLLWLLPWLSHVILRTNSRKLDLSRCRLWHEDRRYYPTMARVECANMKLTNVFRLIFGFEI